MSDVTRKMRRSSNVGMMADPTLYQHWIKASCLLMHYQKMYAGDANKGNKGSVDAMLVLGWINICGAGPPL